MRWHTSSASSSSAAIVADIFRLIPPNERAAFRDMLDQLLYRFRATRFSATDSPRRVA